MFIPWTPFVTMIGTVLKTSVLKPSVLKSAWPPRGFFLGVGKLGVENEGNENPQAGSRDGAPVGVLGQSHPPP